MRSVGKDLSPLSGAFHLECICLSHNHKLHIVSRCKYTKCRSSAFCSLKGGTRRKATPLHCCQMSRRLPIYLLTVVVYN